MANGFFTRGDNNAIPFRSKRRLIFDLLESEGKVICRTRWNVGKRFLKGKQSVLSFASAAKSVGFGNSCQAAIAIVSVPSWWLLLQMKGNSDS